MVEAVKDPTSGAILVFNAGAWTGAYRNPTDTDPTPPEQTAPDWLAGDPPAFETPVPSTVGSVVQLHMGTPVPATALISAEIFTTVPPTIGANGTIPLEWLGQTAMSARFTVRQGNLSTVRTVTALGTITNPGDGFPAYATYELFGAADGSQDWSCVEKRTGSISGARTFSVAGDAVVPSGFTLRAYMGGVAAGVPTDASTSAIDVGQTITTTGGLATGSVVYPKLYWRRTTDGAYKLAHQTVTPYSFTILGLTTPVDPPATFPDLTPTITVSGITAARNAALSKIAAGSFTTDYIIGDTAATSGDYALSNIVNPYSGRIIIRKSGGTYTGTSSTDPSCSNKHVGSVSMHGSRNIWFAGAEIVGSVGATDSNLCGLMNCIVESGTSFTNPPGAVYGVRLTRAKGFTLAHNLFRYWGDSAVLFEDADGISVLGNTSEYITSDEYKVFGWFDNGRVERNWSSRKYYNNPGAHTDFWQNQGWRGQINTRTHYNRILGEANAATIGWTVQGFQMKATGADPNIPMTGSTWEQNMGFTGLTFLNGNTANPGLHAKYNTVVEAGNANIAALISGLVSTVDFNYCAQVNGATFGPGPNGLLRSIGTGLAKNYTPIAADFTYGIPWQSSDGTFISYASQTIKAWEPKSGGRLHWGHGNPCGANLNAREIFDASYRTTASAAAGYPVYPFSWPVLPVIRRRHNSDGYVSDTYTGSWSANTLLPA